MCVTMVEMGGFTGRRKGDDEEEADHWATREKSQKIRGRSVIMNLPLARGRFRDIANFPFPLG